MAPLLRHYVSFKACWFRGLVFGLPFLAVPLGIGAPYLMIRDR